MLLYKVIIISVTLMFIGTGVLTFFIFYPLTSLSVKLSQEEYATVEEAGNAFAQFDVHEKTLLDARCESRLLFHGTKKEKAILLLHGYTNCPKQFEELGEQLFKEGYNVLIPRLPGHGYQDKMTDALGTVSHTELIEYLHQSIAIADTLGEEVTIIGLSAGGTLALWASLFEERVDQIITIAPVAYPSGFAPWLRNFVVRYAAWTPNTFSWWNKELKDTRPAPPYVYHRYASKSMGEILHMLAYIEQQLPQLQKKTHITFVINEGDPALHTHRLYWLRDQFQKHSSNVFTHVYTKEQQLPHDIIDPHNIKENKQLIYQDLLQMIKK